MVKRPEHISCETLGKPGLFGEEKAPGADRIPVFKYLLGRRKEDGARLFPAIPHNRKRGSN